MVAALDHALIQGASNVKYVQTHTKPYAIIYFKKRLKIMSHGKFYRTRFDQTSLLSR